MKLFSYLAFLCFLEISAAFFLEWYLDPKSPTNRAGALSCVFYGIWSFCMIFVYGASESTALAFSHFYYLGSLFVAPSLLWFYLTIAGLKPWTKLAFCAPFLGFSAFVYVDFLVNGFYFERFRPGPLGNIGIVGHNRFWAELAPLVSFVQILGSLAVLLWTRFQNASRRLRHQVDTLVAAVLVTFGLYFFCWYAEVRFEIPDPTVLSGAYLVTATFFMIVRYRFLRRDFPLLERHSSSVVQDAALLVDSKRRILGVNPAALLRFGSAESDLVGRDFAALVNGQRTILREWESAAAGQPLHRWVPCQVGGRSTLLSITSRYDVFGEFVGALVLVGDLRQFDDAVASAGLTEREKEIVLLLMQGMDATECGELLSISPGTVKRHIHNAYEKTGTGNPVQLFNRLLGSGN